MDKTFIMQIDDNTELLGKQSPTMGLEAHPVAFPEFRAVMTKREEAMQTILQHLENYQDRRLYVSTDKYGVETSVNYLDGKFSSMILKGDGKTGERIPDAIATMIVPKQAKEKGSVTLHCLITLSDAMRFRGGTPKREVERILKECLREGFGPYEDKKTTCQPYALWLQEGKRRDIYKLWDTIAGSLLIPGLYMDYLNVGELSDNLYNDLLHDYDEFVVPVRGLIVEDAKPEEASAFPATRFLFDETIVEMAPT